METTVVTKRSENSELPNPQDMLANVPLTYEYDDLLIRPKRSTIASRKDVDLSTEIVPGVTLKYPIIASPMSTISESKMCIKIHEIGGLAILHRFASIEYLEDELLEITQKVPKEYVAFSMGIKESDKTLLHRFAPLAGIVCIDVNIGHHDKTMEMVKFVREKYPHLKIIAGNVSTFDGAKDLCEAGVHCIRATNGGGSVCTTLSTTGVGMPTASSLAECVAAARPYGVTVIADGGHKNASSMTKALALGASAVMIGGILAGSSACPSHAFFLNEKGEYRAKYFGMASRMAQVERGTDVKEGTAPEGISISVPIHGKTRVIIEELVGGIRSGMTFCNARTLDDLRRNAVFVKRTHGEIRKVNTMGVGR